MLMFSMPLSLRASASQFAGAVTPTEPVWHAGSLPLALQNCFLQAVVLFTRLDEQFGGGGVLVVLPPLSTQPAFSARTASPAFASMLFFTSLASFVIWSHWPLLFIAFAFETATPRSWLRRSSTWACALAR